MKDDISITGRSFLVFFILQTVSLLVFNTYYFAFICFFLHLLSLSLPSIKQGIYLNILFSKDICTTLFTAASFTKAKIWKQPKCPSIYP